ncbi:adhesion G-protein coupled receptor G2 [Octopus bimaculoides]|uniref:G-protein coupled receptors family 2 profile 2 domain-containing protein n=1 Tax=Octopus bimaculoides TaxID=37653 RepID=A0A0L8FW06_OCTBM|nr:adhesion G-protein coupled receptor G2 [Octopus bimaculoides]|eukprot:XP_014786614.1 PREDICTED: adhesion G-protein coupled receptor G2-like [Octopus bimaculoides]
MFSLVICHLISMQHNERFEHKSRKIRAFGIAGLFFLLGLSWVLAFLAFGEAAKVFQFLFVTFNTLQGMFIFLFYCLFKEDARDVICLFVCKRKSWKPRQVRKNIKTPSSGDETEDKTTETNL